VSEDIWKWQEVGEDCIMTSFIITLHQILLGWSNPGGWDGTGMQHERWREEEMHAKFNCI